MEGQQPSVSARPAGYLTDARTDDFHRDHIPRDPSSRVARHMYTLRATVGG